MKPKPDLYSENIVVAESKEFIASYCEVSADADGYFITVETDAHEGSAMMTLPCAKKVHKALGRAIKAAVAARESNTEETK